MTTPSADWIRSRIRRPMPGTSAASIWAMTSYSPVIASTVTMPSLPLQVVSHVLCPACARGHEHICTNHLVAPTVETPGDCSMGACRWPSSSGSSFASRPASFSGGSPSNRRRAFAGAQGAPGSPPKPHQIDAQAAMTAVRTSVSLELAGAARRDLRGCRGDARGRRCDDRGVDPTVARRAPARRGDRGGCRGLVSRGALLFLALRARSRLRRADRLRKTATS